MRWRILLFAGLRDDAGSDHLEVELSEERPTVARLRAAAEGVLPVLRKRRFAVAVDARYAREDDTLAEGAEVAFLPPVSGG